MRARQCGARGILLTDFLKNLGWNDFFSNQLDPAEARDGVFARVTEEHRNTYRVICELGDLAAELSGRIRYEAQAGGELPAVGDWVRITPRLNERRATIHACLQRRTAFRRKEAGGTSREQIVAANIDTTFIVCSINRDLNMRRIERYLAMAWESGSEPVVVLTKTDLCENVEAERGRIARAAFGVNIIAVSAHHKSGLQELARYFAPGKTAVLLGSSGVGKSTLVNSVAGRELLKTQEIGDDDTGRHTTTHRQLVVLPGGGLVIDTPGMRELGMAGHDDVDPASEGSGVSQTFEDLEALALQCQFSDCRHTSEPKCAIKAAIDSGELDASRLINWRKLTREQQFHEGRSQRNAKAWSRQINRGRRPRDNYAKHPNFGGDL